MEPRITVLLGAGASVDAGLPLTVQIAERLVERANQQSAGWDRDDWVPALNFVYGSMVGYQAENGGNPLQAVNIERLISALRLLQNAAEHEVAPFVSTWKAGALGLGKPRLNDQMGRSLIEAIGNSLTNVSDSTGVVNSVAQIARVANGHGNSRTFHVAESKILEGLSELLGALESVEYLAPLGDLARAQSGGLDIITLNYDMAIEQMAAETDTQIERGIGVWDPSTPVSFPLANGRINLYKLHGSLDWVERQPGRGMAAPQIESKPVNPEDANTFGQRSARPWIVVGDREKLATDGPTLALLRAAEDALQRTTHLVVVGYSFSDTHINSLIRNWMLGSSERTIGIVDVNWEFEGLDEFRHALLREYGSNPDRKSRLVALSGTTKDRLEEALHRLPAATPDPNAAIRLVEELGNVARIVIGLEGADLHDVRVVMVGTSGSGIDTFTAADMVPPQPQPRGGQRYVTRERWISGTEFEVFTRLPIIDGSKISINGRRLDASFHEAFQLAVSKTV